MYHPSKIVGSQWMLTINTIISVSILKGGDDSFKNNSHESGSWLEYLPEPWETLKELVWVNIWHLVLNSFPFRIQKRVMCDCYKEEEANKN